MSLYVHQLEAGGYILVENTLINNNFTRHRMTKSDLTKITLQNPSQGYIGQDLESGKT